MKKLIIFDFDGVLADSFGTLFPLIRDAMKNAGTSLTENQYRDLFIDNLHRGFRNFIKNDNKFLIFSRFRKENYDKYYYDKSSGVKLFPDVFEFIKKIKKKYTLVIASSSKQENIKNLLAKNGVDRSFDLILANSETSKESMIKEILNKFNAKPEEVIMITDTVGDIKVAKKCGLKTIAVTWGFHDRLMLRTARPNFIVSTLEELSKILVNRPYRKI